MHYIYYASQITRTVTVDSRLVPLGRRAPTDRQCDGNVLRCLGAGDVSKVWCGVGWMDGVLDTGQTGMEGNRERINATGRGRRERTWRSSKLQLQVWRASSLGDGTASVRGSKKARRRGVAKRRCGGRGRGRWIDTREDREDSKAGRKWSNNNAQIRQ